MHLHCSTVDLVLTTHPEHFSSLAPCPSLPLSSDHIPLLLQASTPLPYRAEKLPHTRWDIEHADWTEFASLLEEDHEQVMSDMTARATSTDAPGDVMEEIWSTFLDYSFGAAAIAVGKRVVNAAAAAAHRSWHHGMPEAQAASHELHAALRSYCRHPCAATLARRKAARDRLASMKRSAQQKKWSDLCAAIDANPKVRWNSFRATKPTSSIPPSSVSAPGAPLPACEQEAITNLAAHFAHTCSPFDHTATSSATSAMLRSYLSAIDPHEQHVHDAPFTVKEVAAVCKRAKGKSAHGCDDFSPHFLVHGGASLYAALAFVLN